MTILTLSTLPTFLLRCPKCNSYRIGEINEATVIFTVDTWQSHKISDGVVEIQPLGFSANGPDIQGAEPLDDGPKYICQDCNTHYDAFFSDGSYQLPDGEVVDA